MSDLVKRLRIKAGMIEMGERIAWGSDTALMREAADALEATVRGAREDYKLVPVEPTAEMMAQGGIEMGARDEDARTVWKAMIAAAPAVQAEPQPAEQHPEAVREGAPYDDPAFESLCREHEIWGTAAAAQCAVFWEAGKRVAEQQPAPDVKALVEALDGAARSLETISKLAGRDEYMQEMIEVRGYASSRAAVARSALSAHREQQGGDV